MPALGEILILHGDLPIEHLDLIMAMDESDDTAVQALVDRGIVSDEQIAKARAAQHGVAYVDLEEIEVDANAVALVSAATCRRHSVLPIAISSQDRIVVAMVRPGDVFAIDDLRAESGLPVHPVVAQRQQVLDGISRFLRADDEISELATELEDDTVGELGDAFSVAEASGDDAPIVRLVNMLVTQAINDHASDIHIEPGERNVGIRIRIDGVLHEMQSAPKSIQAGLVSRLKIMADIDIAERRKPQDGRMSVTIQGRKVDLRVATLPTVWGEKVVMRILDNQGASLELADLGLSPRNGEVFQRSFVKPHGMILVTGPTGSGKSTTLYATLNAIARPEVNVLTVEDPVEYRMPGINQVQVNPKAGLTFASALRSFLRSDPDIILVGEIRDHETAQIAVEAALTGHLMLSTLHTNDAASAVTRLIEMGIEPFLVGSALDCVVAQRLARRLCDRCKEETTLTREEVEALGFSLEAWMSPKVHRAVGCTVCSGTGYRGRVALHEVMPVDEEIERLAVARASASEIAQAARAAGMRSLREDGWDKVRAGVTSVDEVLRVAI
ncbi:GspE/PulE family protein [Agromyces sp. MMS24-JH15]|uniref:GspE/PulE family protein n=1 Tax=Agromyces sp. MMS24-JH15 TaxID=3243765 RepID=UPI003747BF93